VSFLAAKPDSKFRKPYSSPDGNYHILRVTDTEVCSSTVLSPQWGTTDLMAALEKKFGRMLTTRNWNTLEKSLK
jgi:hypothetical protein